MEKQRIKTVFRSCRRFLISLLLIFITSLCFAQSLKLTPDEGQNLYTKTDIKFSVTIPNATPSQVQVLAANQKQDITFRSMRKSENYEENGTTIEIWYNFSSTGTYTLTPLSLIVKNRRRNIEFEKITVTDDPATLSPRIVLVFDDGTKVYSNEPDFPSPLLTVKTGRKLHFTVNLQYAIQLVQFSWDIPKDSIFTCTKQFEFTEVKYRERVYSHSLIPVASFEWTGLVPGQQKLPRIRLNAAGYNGYRNELLLPDIIIQFTEGSEAQEEEKASDIFDAAFFQEAEESESVKILPLTREECQKLCRLYSKEHNVFFTYFKARKERLNFENEHGIVSSSNQLFPALFLYIAILIILASIICMIIALHKKHKIRTLLFVVLLILGTAILVYCLVRRHERYGICEGCRIYSIPQESAESVSEVSGGTRVRILERTEKWLYIEIGESSGWCSAESVFIIR